MKRENLVVALMVELWLAGGFLVGTMVEAIAGIHKPTLPVFVCVLLLNVLGIYILLEMRANKYYEEG